VHEETGLLVEPQNAGALANAVARLLEDPPTAERMGRRARRRALANFSFERHVDAYEAVYRSVVADWRARTALI
jgi:glycosyltransferase involved in cell wall biosynthesis